MTYITDATLDSFIKEDVPYIDLTTLVLDIADQRGRIEYFCRDEAVICGSEEVLRIFNKLNVTSLQHLPSGEFVKPGSVILAAEGKAKDLHMVWRVAQNILEYESGIATRTWKLLKLAREVNPRIELTSTRKLFPGTKELSIKAVIVGGGMPHRLGLSETVLVFAQHLQFIGGLEGFLEKLQDIKSRCLEKKIFVEVVNLADAVKVSQAGVDGVQLDKMSPAELGAVVKAIRAVEPRTTILAAGGINEQNIQAYAGTGVDAVVTSAVYFGKPVDIGVRMCADI